MIPTDMLRARSADELWLAADEIRTEVRAYMSTSQWWRPLMSRQHLKAVERGRMRFQQAVDFLIKLATLRVSHDTTPASDVVAMFGLLGLGIRSIAQSRECPTSDRCARKPGQPSFSLT